MSIFSAMVFSSSRKNSTLAQMPAVVAKRYIRPAKTLFFLQLPCALPCKKQAAKGPLAFGKAPGWPANWAAKGCFSPFAGCFPAPFAPKAAPAAWCSWQTSAQTAFCQARHTKVLPVGAVKHIDIVWPQPDLVPVAVAPGVHVVVLVSLIRFWVAWAIQLGGKSCLPSASSRRPKASGQIWWRHGEYLKACTGRKPMGTPSGVFSGR